ncbi:hypothetical protein [Kordiimonas aquimaris]|uniref:hypothetical protein n=1 Tax=Kordiimonas aquimaris TaxID=707591 RepID=UPI0021D124CD|nr:hypothetical protein [Kordiimonas aquimaris]
MTDPQYQAPLGQVPQQQQTNQQTLQPPKPKQPEDTVRDGNIKGTIWRREGPKNDFFATDLAKTYRDKNGDLKDTHSFGKDDLLRVAEVARRAHNRVSALTREEFRKNRQSKPQNRGAQDR